MDKKREQLGMPLGTAQNRLKKRVFFSLVQRLGLDFCFRCKERILTAEDLSLDHVKDWLDVSTDLFWDVENTAFSHRTCNSGGRRSPIQRHFTKEAKRQAQRRHNARYMRKVYTPEKRREKFVVTGH